MVVTSEVHTGVRDRRQCWEEWISSVLWFLPFTRHSSPTDGRMINPLLVSGYTTSTRSSLNLLRSAIPTAAASITSRLSNDLTVTLAIPLAVIFPNPSSSFTRLFTRSMDVRSRYSRLNFLLPLGTGG